METKLDQKQKSVIEKFGVVYERVGFSPAQARILCLLMICDAAELTFEQICSLLNLSKSAVSNALNTLLMMGKIEYQTKPGDRKRYFFVNPSKSATDTDVILKRLSDAAMMHREVLSVRSNTNKTFNGQLKKAIEFNEFLYKELAEVLKKWNKSR